MGTRTPIDNIILDDSDSAAIYLAMTLLMLSRLGGIPWTVMI